MTDHSREITKLLTKVSDYTHRRPSDVFRDWLGLAEHTLDALPRHLESARLTGKPAEDTPEAKGYWQRMGAFYSAREWEWFGQAVNHLMDSTTSGKPGTAFADMKMVDRESGLLYQDIPGPIYMEYVNPSGHNGQFFTPWHVAVVMAQMTVTPDILYQRIEETLLATDDLFVKMVLRPLPEGEPRTEGRIAVLRHLLPIALPTIRPVSVSDPACGSGVMLLAAASQFPQWANELGLVQYYGQDIDGMCVSMARVNMMLYGLNGYALRCRIAMEGIELPTPAVNDPQEEEGAKRLPPPAPDIPIGQLSLDLQL